jgi:hypothetical protein
MNQQQQQMGLDQYNQAMNMNAQQRAEALGQVNFASQFNQSQQQNMMNQYNQAQAFNQADRNQMMGMSLQGTQQYDANRMNLMNQYNQSQQMNLANRNQEYGQYNQQQQQARQNQQTYLDQYNQQQSAQLQGAGMSAGLSTPGLQRQANTDSAGAIGNMMQGIGSVAGMFAGGFKKGTTNVPTDMVTSIHKGEIVIPAKYAAKIRDKVDTMDINKLSKSLLSALKIYEEEK